MDTQETEQHQLVYITDLKDGLQKNGTKLYNEEGPNNKKPAAENRFIEEPTLNNLNHIYELYKESGSDNENIEDFVKGENKKNLKEKDYTNIASSWIGLGFSKPFSKMPISSSLLR